MPSRFGATGPDLNRLQAQLLVSGLQQKDPPLYQVINQLIDQAIRIQKLTDDLIATNTTNITGLAEQEYLTASDQTAVLPNSRNLLAGTGITFDDSVQNERTISAGAAEDGVWVPLTDGDPVEADLIFNSFGECIMVFVPNP